MERNFEEPSYIVTRNGQTRVPVAVLAEDDSPGSSRMLWVPDKGDNKVRANVVGSNGIYH